MEMFNLWHMQQVARIPLSGMTLIALFNLLSCAGAGERKSSRSADTSMRSAVASPAVGDTVKPVGDNSRVSLDWEGTYKGILPCADCPGIETVVTLGQDGNYSRWSRYLERDKVAPLTERGTFTWSADGRTVKLGGDASGPSQYMVGEGRLIQLDMEGKPIVGSMAQAYILEKEPGSGLVAVRGTHWRLVELMGKPVPAPSDARREPYILLDSHEGKLSGSGGCNRIMGAFTIDDSGGLAFSGVASTRMMCPEGMDTEALLLKVLGEVDRYSMRGDSLLLSKGRMAPSARFLAMQTKK
jgi:copper homeostasis protein (lipoprotein)